MTPLCVVVSRLYIYNDISPRFFKICSSTMDLIETWWKKKALFFFM